MIRDIGAHSGPDSVVNDWCDPVDKSWMQKSLTLASSQIKHIRKTRTAHIIPMDFYS